MIRNCRIDKDQKEPRGSYPLHALKYDLIVGDEISKASRANSQRSEAMCALETEKRLGTAIDRRLQPPSLSPWMPLTLDVSHDVRLSLRSVETGERNR